MLNNRNKCKCDNILGVDIKVLKIVGFVFDIGNSLLMNKRKKRSMTIGDQTKRRSMTIGDWIKNINTKTGKIYRVYPP